MASGGTSDVNLNVRYGRVQIAARARENAMNEARNEVKLVGKQPGFSATNAKTSRNEAPSPSKTTTMRPINRISTPTSRLPSNVQQQQRQQASKSISTYQRQLMDQLKLETRVQAAIPNRILDEEREEETNPKEIYAQVNSHREARLGVDRESDEGNENHNHCHHHHHHHPHAQQTRPAESHNQQLNLNQHKPHCVHHNPSCLKHPVHQNHLHLHHQHQHQNHNHHHNHLRSNSNHLLSPAPTTRGPFVEGPHKWRSLHPNIKPPDYPYLLVEYRTPGEGLQAASTPSATMEDDVGDRGGNGSKRRRSTVGFISQLYFLLHLSAIISLLLHHNSLVSSERKHQMYRNSLGTGKFFLSYLLCNHTHKLVELLIYSCIYSTTLIISLLIFTQNTHPLSRLFLRFHWPTKRKLTSPSGLNAALDSDDAPLAYLRARAPPASRAPNLVYGTLRSSSGKLVLAERRCAQLTSIIYNQTHQSPKSR